MGLTLDDLQGSNVDVWPENHDAVRVFMRMGRQWRHGMSGPTGLDLSAVPMLMRALKIPRDRLLDVLDSISVMEATALEVMYEN